MVAYAGAPSTGAPMGYGGPTGQRDRITQALMAIQNPPPATQMPRPPTPPLAAPQQAAGMPPTMGATGMAAPIAGSGMTGAPPGAPTAAQPMGGMPMPAGPYAPPQQPMAQPNAGPQY